MRRFSQQLLQWYSLNKRDLPWRKDNSPYRVLISEIMLQQTQVPRVIEKFHEFLQKFPTIQDLAKAYEDEDITTMEKIWYTLGEKYLFNVCAYLQIDASKCMRGNRRGELLQFSCKPLIAPQSKHGPYGALSKFVSELDNLITKSWHVFGMLMRTQYIDPTKFPWRPQYFPGDEHGTELFFLWERRGRSIQGDMVFLNVERQRTRRIS